MVKTTDFTQFKPRDYLDYYYTRIDNENQSLLEFFAGAYKKIQPDSVMLEFGGGPTIYQLISAANYAKEIDFCDYLQSNLDEIKSWQDDAEAAFDWRPFMKRALEIEYLPNDEPAIEAREQLVRDKLDKLLLADAFKTNPCGPEHRGAYDVLGVNFVPEGITNSKEDWESAMTNISSLLKSGGTMIMAAITEAEYWHSGEQVLPAVYLTEKDFRDFFPKINLSIQGFKLIPAEVTDPADPNYTGYKGMAFIEAHKA